MMKNSKLIWIDIGTHFGQEYKSIFSNQTYFAWKLFRRFIGSKVFSKGKFLKISELAELFKNRKALRKNKNIFYFTFIEANPKIIAMKVYSEANDVFCLALGQNKIKKFSVGKLYHVDRNETSQGNSIYKTKTNVNINNFTTCVIQNPFLFATEYKGYLDELFSNYKIILRLNCEGSEDDIIYALKNCFQEKLKYVFGSLKDVKTVKGDKAFQKMMSFIQEKELSYVDFSSSVETCPKAFKKINQIIN